MFSPACSPAWSATEPSCGSTSFVLVSVIQAMSPTANTSGWPATLRSGSAGTRLPCCSSTPSDSTSGLACRPAPHTSVCASSTVPDFERDAGRLDRGDHLAQQHLDAALLQRLLRVGADVGLEHRQERRAGLDEDDPCLVLRDPRVVLGEVAAVQLGERAGALDAGGPAADDDDVERAVRRPAPGPGRPPPTAPARGP